jgi:hypothetical protein
VQAVIDAPLMLGISSLAVGIKPDAGNLLIGWAGNNSIAILRKGGINCDLLDLSLPISTARGASGGR